MTFNVKAILIIVVGGTFIATVYLYIPYARCLAACKQQMVSPEVASAACNPFESERDTIQDGAKNGR
jgi:hypothetical protein